MTRKCRLQGKTMTKIWQTISNKSRARSPQSCQTLWSWKREKARQGKSRPVKARSLMVVFFGAPVVVFPHDVVGVYSRLCSTFDVFEFCVCFSSFFFGWGGGVVFWVRSQQGLSKLNEWCWIEGSKRIKIQQPDQVSKEFNTREKQGICHSPPTL